MSLTITDLFCGAGGSSTGAVQVPGVTVRLAANHWNLAVETHNANHPDTDHDCADLSQVEPSRYPRTDILWASPECTNHSQAKGRKRNADAMPDLFGDTLPDEAAERSRATMWDVVRFAEYHRYSAIVVENVVDVALWVLWPAWRSGLDALGYCLHSVYLNSMHAQASGLPAPQSRDRLYVVAHLRKTTCPDLNRWTRPTAYCEGCDARVRAMQAWKKPERTWGRYRAQYVWRCPNVACRNQVVEPGWLPAAAAIDWSLTGERIGDRTRPLADKTMQRIRAGLERYTQPELLVPVEGRDGKTAASVWDAMRTMTTRNETGLLVPAGGTWNETATPLNQVMQTRTTRESEALVVPLRNNNTTKTAADPFDTFAANGNHHALVMRNNGSRYSGAEMVTPVTETLRTLTTAGHQSLLEPMSVAVEDCLFRMLEPHEVAAGMAFTPGYLVLGNKREKVRQLGNAVTPPAARDLIAAVAEALGHDLTSINAA
ncbi:DNA cytosine methyltransferase [Kribbella sandramycini]|uniref:DNA (cytosine-5-)-methyltransferase n=1 Tax=Kribbella sandramycini TaxID=60450 RepID=A0A7Y4L4W9_9ACTN|nr:DNA cytosine methyltransferase [Kribbella sandramycini]NOL44353.1 DNA cytosine methyltransferase [Kribbella sandramycini]